MLEVLVGAKNGGSVLKTEIWQEIDVLNQFITKKLVVTRGERNIRFRFSAITTRIVSF
jgi:hypothetical protein